ncbi:MAG TPA: hypothetical protein VG122_05510 [Gemmata sp.]|jgi:hypothetical protein|nr:hypothetical protein [Gemmata sp.]
MTRFSSYLVVVLFLFPLGCGKKTVKFTGSSDNPTSPQNTQTAGVDKDKPGDKAKKAGDKANLSNNSVFDSENQTFSGDGNQAGGVQGKPGWGIPRPEGGWESPNPQPAVANPGGTPGSPTKLPAPGGPGVASPNAGASPPVGTATTTGTKPVSEADMKDVWIFIENRSGASGQMPAPRETYAALIAAKSPAADLAKDGSIVLTGARTRESIWAYEARAIKQGGLVATQNGVENLTATELIRRLAGQ